MHLIEIEPQTSRVGRL